MAARFPSGTIFGEPRRGKKPSRQARRAAEAETRKANRTAFRQRPKLERPFELHHLGERPVVMHAREIADLLDSLVHTQEAMKAMQRADAAEATRHADAALAAAFRVTLTLQQRLAPKAAPPKAPPPHEEEARP